MAGSAERVYDLDPLHDPAVAHVLSIKLAAAERPRRSDDRAVPIREAVPGCDLQCRVQDCKRHLLYAEAGPRPDEICRHVMRQPMRSRGTCRLCIKFLEHLD